MTIRAENEMTLVRVDDGEEGEQGTTFYPNVSQEGVISWANDGEKPNPEPVVIKGPQGISLNSVTRYYKLSDTTPTDYPPSTGWQTSEPAYTPGDARNLYICDLFAWSNSTVTASEISLSSSFEAAKQAYNAAQGAMTAANGKNKVYHSALEPTGGTYNNGDIWFDTDNDYKMYIHNGTSWEASAFGNNAIASSGIDAGKITVGTLDANRIAAKSLVIGQMADESQSQILNSNIQVGARNLLLKTGDLSQWYHDTTYVSDDDFNGSEVNLGHGTELSWSYVISSSNADMVFPYADVKDKQFTISFEAKVDVVGSGTSEYLHYTVNGQATAGGSKTKYMGWSIYNNSTSTDRLNTTYTKYSRTLTINDALFTSGSGDVNFVYFSFYNYTFANVSVRNIKLELGNKATDWTPAPEDMASKIELASANESIIEDIENNYYSHTELGQSLSFNETDGLIIQVPNSPYETRISNTQIEFRYQGIPVAYINGQILVIPKSMMLDEMMVGDNKWSWRIRDNGNLQLKWIG